MDRARFTLTLPLGAAAARAAFPPIETWLRLNPQWEFGSIEGDPATGEFRLKVCYDRSGREAGYRVRARMPPDGNAWRFELAANGEQRLIELDFDDTAAGVRLALQEDGVPESDSETRTELALWLRSTVDYLLLSTRRSPAARLVRLFLDRVWLRMGPTGRRVAFLVLAFDAAALALFLLWLAWYRLSG